MLYVVKVKFTDETNPRFREAREDLAELKNDIWWALIHPGMPRD